MASPGGGTATKKVAGKPAPAPPPREHHELHLYPGEKRLFFVVDGKLVLDVEAWGGPPSPIPKRPGEPFGADPTLAGRFRIGWIGRYQTASWGWSKIRWGTRIKLNPADDKDLLYESSPGRWPSVRRKTGLTRDDVRGRYEQLYHQVNRIPATWVFNDFGPIAVRYYEDRNRNHRQDANEPLSGEMFHTTPDNEADRTSGLYTSHGCIHLRPADRDLLLGQDAFKVGTLLVIHNYGETSGVPKTTTTSPAPGTGR
jgi:hypothetical protein